MTEHERMRKQLWCDERLKSGVKMAADHAMDQFDETFPDDYAELEKERDELKKALKEVWDICIEDTPWNKSAMQENTVSYLYERLESFRDLIIDKDNT